MRSLLLASLVPLTFGIPTLGAQGVHINMLPWREPVLMDTLKIEAKVSATPEKVYLAAQKAFGDLGIPLGNTDNKVGVLGSERFQRSHNLNGTILSKLFDCGEGATGPYADAYRLEIAVAAFVKPDGEGGTTLGVATLATGRDPGGTSRAARACTSTGRLEDMLTQRVRLAALTQK